jgi:hypothetical protein
VLGPEILQAQHQLLEGQRILRGRQMVFPDGTGYPELARLG